MYINNIRKLDSNTVNTNRKKIGGKWKPMILLILKDKPARFNKIKQLMNGVSSNMLTLSLRQMEEDRLLFKTDQGHYALTDQACKIVDLLIEIKILVEAL